MRRLYQNGFNLVYNGYTENSLNLVREGYIKKEREILLTCA